MTNTDRVTEWVQNRLEPSGRTAMDPQLRRVREELLLQAPAKQFEYLLVTFPSLADTDWTISTMLTPESPEGLIYQVVRADRPCQVYSDQSATRTPWQAGKMILRCNVANASVTLRVEIPRGKVTFP